MPIYVGQEVIGPGSHKTSASQGVVDGGQTVALMHEAGFAQRRYVCLDLENGMMSEAVMRTQMAYVKAWCDTVTRSGYYKPAVYCSYKLRTRVHNTVPDARLWCFKVPTVGRTTFTGTKFLAPDPTSLGAGVTAWQYRQNVKITVGGVSLVVDMDSATTADPGA